MEDANYDWVDSSWSVVPGVGFDQRYRGYRYVALDHCDGRLGWIEGFSIILAVLICVNIAAINNYQKEKQFRSLNEENNKAMVKVYVVV